MIFGLLVESATLAILFIVIAFILSRFTGDIVGCSLLVIFLFVAASGLAFGSAYTLEAMEKFPSRGS